MTKLANQPDHPFAVDLRIGRARAAEERAPAAAYSLWPEEFFGASADTGVWPSAFVLEARPGPSRVPLRAGEAPEWEAFGTWPGLATMAPYLLPTDPPGEIVALAMDRACLERVPPDMVSGVLCAQGVDEAALDAEAALLGFDIVDDVLQSMVFDAMHGPEIRAQAPPRSEAGLIASREDAAAFLPLLEEADPAHAPLLIVAVYSLGVLPV